jgi:anti-sigma factor RsiW
MSEDEWFELVDLYVADQLPEALRAGVDARLAADPAAAEDMRTLRETMDQLKAQPAERPDPWYVERVIDGLLREHGAAQNTQRETSFETRGF